MDETIVDPDEGSNGAGPPPAAFEEPEPFEEPETAAEPGPRACPSWSPWPRPSPSPSSGRSRSTLGGARVRGGSVPEPEPEPEPDLEPELEPVAELEIVEAELEAVEEETPPDADVVFDMKPDLVELPEPAASGDAAVSDLESELGSLQETARRADELAGERRAADQRAEERRRRELRAARGRPRPPPSAGSRSSKLRISGVDTLAEELRRTTAKLEEVNRVLEGSVG